MGRSIAGAFVAGLVLAVLPSPAGPRPSTAAVGQGLVPSAVVALASEGVSRIAVVDDDGDVRVLTGGAVDVAPVASPDGSRAAFVRGEAARTGDGGLAFGCGDTAYRIAAFADGADPRLVHEAAAALAGALGCTPSLAIQGR